MELKTYTIAASGVRAAKSAVAKLSLDLIISEIRSDNIAMPGEKPLFIGVVKFDHKEADIPAAALSVLDGFKVECVVEADPVETPAAASQGEKSSAYIPGKSIAKGATKRVWEIADSMPGAKRGDVVNACVAEGIAFGTARTQYQKWKSAKA